MGRTKYIAKGSISSESVIDTVTDTNGNEVPDVDVSNTDATGLDLYMKMGIGDKTNGITGSVMELNESSMIINDNVIILSSSATADDLVAAVNIMNTNGGVIYLPPKTFTLSSTLLITKGKLIGTDRYNTIIESTGTGHVVALGGNGVIIRDLRIKGDNTLQATILQMGSYYCIAENLILEGSVADDYTNAIIGLQIGSKYNQVKNIEIYRVRHGVKIYNHYNNVSNVYTNNIGENCIYISSAYRNNISNVINESAGGGTNLSRFVYVYGTSTAKSEQNCFMGITGYFGSSSYRAYEFTANSNYNILHGIALNSSGVDSGTSNDIV